MGVFGRKILAPFGDWVVNTVIIGAAKEILGEHRTWGFEGFNGAH